MKYDLKKRIWAGILAFLMVYIIFTPINIGIYATKDETRHADAAIVLGAAIDGEKPSPVFEERIKHAILLYKDGYVKKLVFTGGKSEGEIYSEAAVAKMYAIKNGVPETDIYLEELSTITQENLEFSLPIFEKEKLKSVLVVSDPLHMKRAMCMAKDYGFQAYTSPTKTSRYRSFGTKTEFLARETVFYSGYLMQRLFR